MRNANTDPDDPSQPVVPKGIERLVEAGAAIGGSVVGVGVAFFWDPYVGAAVGAAIQQAGSEVAARLLSRREQARVGKVMSYAAERLEMFKANGRAIRNDGFFAEDVDRSDGAEVFEAVLLAAQRDHEEKKLRYYGNLLARIAVDPVIADVGFANLLIRYANELSYRQLSLLALINDRDQYNLRDEHVREGDTWQQRAVLEELDDLGWGRRNMVLPVSEWDGSGRRPLPEKIGHPASSQLANFGQVLHIAMDLKTINKDDIRQLADLLS